MNQLRLAAGFVLATLLAAAAAAQQVGPPAPPPANADDAEGRAPIIKQFDANGDGELNADEIGRARQFMQALRRELGDRMEQRRGDRGPRGERGERGDEPRGDRPRPAREFGRRGPGDEGPPLEGDGPRGERRRRDSERRDSERRDGERRDGERGPRAAGDEGPPETGAPPRRPGGEPMQLFKRFDADANGELNPEEFRGLMGALRERRGPGGPPDGSRFGRRPGPPEGVPGPRAERPPGPPPAADGGPPPRRFRPGDGERGERNRGDRNRGDGERREGQRSRRLPRDGDDEELTPAPAFEAPAVEEAPAADPNDS